MSWYFLFFFISGFCGILYELVWLRLAMSQFGVTTPLISAVLSIFMGGLGLGSWVAGRALRRYGDKIRFPPLRIYAAAELLIGTSALVLPTEFSWAHRFLQSLARSSASSGTYYVASGALIALTMIPWCACMGATIPLAMFSIRCDERFEARRSFSFLYISNVVGAVIGTILPLLLIEQYGFRATLRIGAMFNGAIALLAWGVTRIPRGVFRGPAPAAKEAFSTPRGGKGALFVLFMTGLTTMGMELIWIRVFTPYIDALVYSFAVILFSYLLGTFVGSCVYRDGSKKSNPGSQAVWLLFPLAGSLPLLLADPRLPFITILRVFLGIAPFAAAAGYLTPMLVDRWAAGDPDRAGRAYAVNVMGCIIGPLLSGFVLLPIVGEHLSMVFFILPWLAMAAPWQRYAGRPLSRVIGYASLAVSVTLLVFTKDYAISLDNPVVLRDSTATVSATGTGMNKLLLVNGRGMTHLQPTTKMMAHLTLASLEESPRSVLVICFGMGTTFRSVISWGVPATVVELVPSVPKLFPFYHSDARKVLASPFSHVVIDDGRRYLERSSEKYDVIIIDPPPPVSAAGSSLLYSEEFYKVAQKHLTGKGILQQWLPGTGSQEQASVARALSAVFPYVRVFPALEPSGWHFLASTRPIPIRTARELAQRVPPDASADMLEWGPARTPELQFDLLLSGEMTPAAMIALSPETPALQDDRPINEYFLLRAFFGMTASRVTQTTGVIVR